MENKPLGISCVLLLTLLCVCILMQMLGVPVTLLNPMGAADALDGSLLEGFAVPPAVVPLMAAGQTSSLLVQIEPPVHDAVLTAVPFHPPV